MPGMAIATADEDWRAVIDTNLTGAFFVARQFLPAFLANGFGRFIFMSSIAANGMSGDVAYSASKAGMLGLSGALAKEYGRKGITSNALLMSLFETEMTLKELSAKNRDFYASALSRRAHRAGVGGRGRRAVPRQRRRVVRQRPGDRRHRRAGLVALAMGIGIEKIGVYPCALSLDIADLCDARGLDAANFCGRLFCDERSVMGPFEDVVTLAVNAAHADADRRRSRRDPAADRRHRIVAGPGEAGQLVGASLSRSALRLPQLRGQARLLRRHRGAADRDRLAAVGGGSRREGPDHQCRSRA